MESNIKEITLFEHQFWLQILGDHSRFIFNALGPKEVNFIQLADVFIKTFDNLLKKSRQDNSHDDVEALNKEAYVAATKLREFKLNIISRQVEGKIDISLPPTLINHMVNELDEYLLMLTALTKEKYANAKPLHLHLLWLPDASGHAAIISSNVDATQKDIIKRMKKYCKKFDNLYLAAIEYGGFMRTGITEFPALDKLNIDASKIMNKFKETLKELKKCVGDKKVLSTLAPLVYDHMFREECYYLVKLSLVSNIDKPNCNPAKPREE